MKTKFLFSFLFVSIISMGQTSSTHVQTLVNSVSSEITLDTEQINQLTIAAEQYVLAIQAANEEHSIDDAALVQAKGGGITISDKVVEDYQEGVISSGEYIKLTNGFHAKADSNLHILKDMQCNAMTIKCLHTPHKKTPICIITYNGAISGTLYHMVIDPTNHYMELTR